MPRPNDSPDVKASKALAYILRHGAEKEGLDMRSDGYLKLTDVLARPKMRDIDTEMVLRLVAENAKQRFELTWAYDPSPPKIKPKKGQGKGKGKGKSQPRATDTTVDGELAKRVEADSEVKTDPNSNDSRTVDKAPADAAKVDDLAVDLAKASVSTELPLVVLPRPEDESSAEGGSTSQSGEWFIRATQGHSIKLESVSHLTPVGMDEEGLARAGLCVHGTRWELWETLKSTGLSRMARTHIHLAPALSDHAIVPRPNSTLRIYLDPRKLSAGNIPLYTSLNGVVLTPGNEEGVVGCQYWKMAERKVEGEWVEVWRDGEEVEAGAA